MKLKYREINKDGSGFIRLIPEEAEDMWHLYNLISVGDELKGTAIRRVQSESTTGSTSSERVKVTLTIEVSTIDFDAQSGLLRAGGKNVSENKFVKMGAFQTIEVEPNREFTIAKQYWDVVSLDRISAACDPTKFADVAAVVMAEGLAHLCLITPAMTIVRQKLEVPIPRKRKAAVEAHEKGLQRFFEQVLQALLRHVNFDIVKCVIIASPGFTKDQFFEYMNAEAVRQDIKVLFENKAKFMLCHSSSAHKHALKEILMDPAMMSRLSDTKAAGEMKALNDFYDMLKVDQDRAFYGIKHVLAANERMAIQTLLITDELFRSADISTRRQYIALVESVRESGGDVKIFSSMHVSGEQLGQITGVAAILRFPIPEIDDDSDDDAPANGTA
eukprot:TRINITY_DN11903_c0_g1_i1.p1 TRINITY_DN11903_c0_g1~~TRINITY_DN11903_c0_g1_i1.p1  ORF type:complete len:388 (-),score=185.01 TRINITY_DN11903_c0_g1_i1:603-1766(-)